MLSKSKSVEISTTTEISGRNIFRMIGGLVKISETIIGIFPLEYFLKSANQGDADGQYAVGYLYKHGEGVEQDLTKAFEFYLKSANQGDADAQYALGNTYYYGKGVGQDLTKAFEFYLKSANQGVAGAQRSVGYLYYFGERS